MVKRVAVGRTNRVHEGSQLAWRSGAKPGEIEIPGPAEARPGWSVTMSRPGRLGTRKVVRVGDPLYPRPLARSL